MKSNRFYCQHLLQAFNCRSADVSQVALIIARQQDVIANGDVFYNLVKQDVDKEGNLLNSVKSNDAVVNVLPQKR